jgi:hypothetical protein
VRGNSISGCERQSELTGPAEFNIASQRAVDIGARVVTLRIRTGAAGNQFFVGLTLEPSLSVLPTPTPCACGERADA